MTNDCRLISYIQHTCECKQYCYVGNTAKQCRLGLFQDSDFAGDLEDSKSTSGGTLCVLGSHTFGPISWMCKKQTSVSHSSTESEIISLDTGLRLDGLPALELWDLIVSVLGNVSRVSNRSGKPECDIHKQHNLKPLIITSMSNSWKASPQQATQSVTMTVLGLLKSGKTETTTYDRSGRLDNMNSQEVARPQNFVMGNDETELDLSVETRSFVNRVNDQVRKETETNFKCYRKWRETFYDLGNVHDCNNGISSIHGKELPEQLSIHL